MFKFLNSLKAYLKKECTEGIRTRKFLILAIGVLFFSIADPILLKLMPEILKSQMHGIDLSGIVDLSQKAAMANYAKDLYQIATLFIVFTLMGIIAAERADKTLTIPISMGCSVSSIVFSKTLVYGIYLSILSIMGMSIAYFYSGIIFESGYATFTAVLKAGFLYGIFFIFVISILTLLSTMVKKPFIGGIATLLIIYFMPLLAKLLPVDRYLPTQLLREANYFSMYPSADLTVSLICTIAAVVILNIISIVKLENTELV